MALKIEDYALIGNSRTAALVGKDGSIDWMCVPRFDSSACFAALLGTEDNGRWIMAPKSEKPIFGKRKYWDDTLVLETRFETETGKARVIDAMVTENNETLVVRSVEGLKGSVEFHTEIIIRFDYGTTVPWVRKDNGGFVAVAGPDNIKLESDVPLSGKNFRTRGEFVVQEGERKNFVLRYFRGSKEIPPKIRDPWQLIHLAAEKWKSWCTQGTYHGPYRSQVQKSVMVLKALTYKPTGGIVAAPTTSLPENIGGVRNWDYRFCWLRDATFILSSMMLTGYKEEAEEWREWLLRAIAGSPSQIKVLYGVGGERFNTELEVPWLKGYEKSLPVRIGNGAHSQFQLDIYGELGDTFYLSGAYLSPSPNAKQGWHLYRALIENLKSQWKNPDRGIWEIRGEPQHFVHSKVMAWVAVDRAIRMSEERDFKGPVEDWLTLREEIKSDILKNGFHAKKNTFVQAYGSSELDASLLLLPLVGFIKASDPRMIGTVNAIEKELLVDGFIKRYSVNKNHVDGLPGSEGAFLPCSFWYVDNLHLQGRDGEARVFFEKLLGLCNDVGLLAEEYDPKAKRMLGNFPQAFSHVSLINSALNLSLQTNVADLRSCK